MSGEHVATSHAKEGGPCPGCGMPIGVNNTIYKYSTDGVTTRHGQGPGVWVCRWCHTRMQIADAHVVPDLFTCDGCGRACNPVVDFNGKRYCPDCYGGLSAESGRLV